MGFIHEYHLYDHLYDNVYAGCRFSFFSRYFFFFLGFGFWDVVGLVHSEQQ
jgi:hypothetical protein